MKIDELARNVIEQKNTIVENFLREYCEKHNVVPAECEMSVTNNLNGLTKIDVYQLKEPESTRETIEFNLTFGSQRIYEKSRLTF